MSEPQIQEPIAQVPTPDPVSSDPVVTQTSDPVPTPSGNPDPTPPIEATWPENWRSLIAGEDEKMQKYLDRFNSPSDIAKSGIDFRDKIAKGEYKRATEAPKDDEVAMKEWRSENGIPESPDKYTTPEGIIFGEEDQPLVNEFLKDMYESNIPDAHVQPALKWYANLQQKAAEQEVEMDRQMVAQTEEDLRAEWGAEYRANLNEVDNFVKGRFPEEVANALMSSPDTVKALASISREINPAVTLFPNSQNPSQSIEDEIETIKGKMHSDEYKANPKMQKRYQDLLVAQGKIRK